MLVNNSRQMGHKRQKNKADCYKERVQILVKQTLFWVSVMPLIGYVTLGKFFNISKS